jgi:hypothetical protein
VMVARRITSSIWLAMCDAPAGVRLRGRGRRVADRAAAARAWTTAVKASGVPAEHVVGSRAHTEGAGAALVGPKGAVLGIDLVSPRRITLRHACAILDPEEWDVLPGTLGCRAALGWGLKEAAAKALGTPVRHFPAGLRITRALKSLEVIDRDEPRSSVLGHWATIGSLLCVWVFSHPDYHGIADAKFPPRGPV